MPSGQADFVVIGGGPAGAAAALTLRRHAPGRSVVLLEAGQLDRAKPGEVLAAVAQGLLRQIGAWAPFQAAAFIESRGIVSAWVDEEPDERHSIFSAQGAGWHLDRARFDRLLVDAAAALGTEVKLGNTVRSAVREGHGWRLELTDGEIVAGAVIWATGRNWKLSRPFGATLRLHHHLVAFIRFFDGAPGDCRMAVEARPEGWWYCADLPDQRLVVACLTDPDLGRNLHDRNSWYRALARTRLIAPRVPASAHETADLAKSAATVTVDPAAGERWVAAGDTLFAADPLSSRGILHALRSGILAAYAVADMLDGRADLARMRYAQITARGFAGYASALATRYGAAAGRWDTPFWQRRLRQPEERTQSSLA